MSSFAYLFLFFFEFLNRRVNFRPRFENISLLPESTALSSFNICYYLQTNDPSMKSSQAITKILPLMIGYFALSVPSGLSLYW